MYKVITFLMVILAYASFCYAVPVPQTIADQVAYQGAVLQQQVAAGVNQIANQVAYQANVAMQQAAIQQAQVAHAVNTIAAQTTGAVGR